MSVRLLILLVLVLLPFSASARQVDESALDDQIREISKTLRCAVCQTENIWESQSTLAAQMRAVVRTKLEEGRSPEEIKAYFLSRYGDYILMKPRKKGLNWLIWAGPFVLLLIGGALLYRALSKWSKVPPDTPSEEQAPIDTSSRERIERELRAFNK